MITRNRAVALCRVSSLEQLLNNSLSTQQDNVIKAAEFLNVIIMPDGVWAGQQSGKIGLNYNRKDLLAIFEYCKRHPEVMYLIVQEVDRFMRSPEEQVFWQVKFKYELGVKIWYADKPELNDDTHNASLFRFLEGWTAGGSNEERMRKAINGNTAALEHGRYPFSIKPGYVKGRMSGVPDIHPVEGPAFKRALISIADRGVRPTQALKDLNNSEFRSEGRVAFKMDKFRKFATDPFYAGILEIDKKIKVRNEHGLHEPLITIEQHKRIVAIFNGKPKNQKGPTNNGNPDFPLNNLVTCTACKNERTNRFVGMNLKNGKQYGKIYPKYRCRTCNKYISKDELHEEISTCLSAFSLTDQARRELMLSLLSVWKTEERQVLQDISRMRSRTKELQVTIKAQVKAAVDPSNASIKQDILAQVDENKLEVIREEEKITKLEQLATSDKENFLTFAFEYLDDPVRLFTSPDIEKEKRVLCKDLLIPSGFFLDSKNKVYTLEISPIYRLEPSKKDTEVSQKASMVRVQGL